MKTYSYESLSIATLDFLKRIQRDEAKGDALVVSTTGKAAFIYWLLGGMMLLFFSICYFCFELWSWGGLPFCLVGLCVGIYCVLRGTTGMFKTVRYEFRDGLYITRLHIIRTEPSVVRVAPLTSIANITFEDAIQNGRYGWTTLSFSYDEHMRGVGTISNKSLAILFKDRLREYLEDLKIAVENVNLDYFASNDLFRDIPEMATHDETGGKKLLITASVVLGVFMFAFFWHRNNLEFGDSFPWADPGFEGDGALNHAYPEDVVRDVRYVKERDHAVISCPEMSVDAKAGGMALYYVTNSLPYDIYVLVAGEDYYKKRLVKKSEGSIFVMPPGCYERCIIVREKFHKRPRPAYSRCKFDAGVYFEGFDLRREWRRGKRWEKKDKAEWEKERPEDRTIRKFNEFSRQLDANMKNIQPLLLEEKSNPVDSGGVR